MVGPAKKTLVASERDEVARTDFRQRLAQRPAADFVIVDEMGSKLNLTPRSGRAPRGQRAHDHVPRNTPINTTVIAACTLEGMGPALLVDGATDTAAFVVSGEQVLAPTLQPGQVVVLDNLSAHKSPKVATAIAARGGELW